MAKNITLFEVTKENSDDKIDLRSLEDTSRFIRYRFNKAFLKLKNIGAT